MNAEEELRRGTETFLLTLLSRLQKVSCVVVLVGEEDGTYTHHKGSYSVMLWGPVLGELDIMKQEILTKMVKMRDCTPSGEFLEEPSED